MPNVRGILGYVGLVGAVASCGPMIGLALVGLLGALGAGAIQTSSTLGVVAAALTAIAQPLMIASLLILVATMWSRGRRVFGLTVVLSLAAEVFMNVPGLIALTWLSLGLLAAVLVSVTIRERRAQSCAPVQPLAVRHADQKMTR